MILHIPHSSRAIPGDLRDQIVLTDNDLSTELTLMTDAFTDELFDLPGILKAIFPISRLLVDVERFPIDTEEPMSRVGMGVIYTRTANGAKLKRVLKQDEIQCLISEYYEAHHKSLLQYVERELKETGTSLILDCHSFPSKPLPCDQDQSHPRPDFCVGTDSFHTPGSLMEMAAQTISRMGYDVGINRPYAGSIVPREFFKQDRRVMAVMIEVNRMLYMDETAGTKSLTFDKVKRQLHTFLGAIRDFQVES